MPRPTAEPTVPSMRGKGRIRALVHRGVRDDKLPRVTRSGPRFADPTLCGGCGAVFARRTWRRDRGRLDSRRLSRAVIGWCPACRQAAAGRSFGRLLVQGAYARGHADEILRRLRNVAARAGFTQPERRVVRIRREAGALEVFTTSQKLAHRMARELKKAFRGRAAYSWSEDGSLFAVWQRD